MRSPISKVEREEMRTILVEWDPLFARATWEEIVHAALGIIGAIEIDARLTRLADRASA